MVIVDITELQHKLIALMISRRPIRVLPIPNRGGGGGGWEGDVCLNAYEDILVFFSMCTIVMGHSFEF